MDFASPDTRLRTSEALRKSHSGHETLQAWVRLHLVCAVSVRVATCGDIWLISSTVEQSPCKR